MKIEKFQTGQRRKWDYIFFLLLFLIFIAIIGPFSIEVKTKSQKSSSTIEKKCKVKDISLYLIKEVEKYIPESIWPDNEFPVKIYIAKKGTNLVGIYKLEEVNYITPKKEKISKKK